MFGRKNKERKCGASEMKEEMPSKRAVEGCSGCSKGSRACGGTRTGNRKSK